MSPRSGLRNLFVVIVAVTHLASASADPITSQEAADWVAHVRRLMNWGPEVDLAQEAETRLLRANFGLMRVPDSREFFRDRGDAFHTLGHMAEHKHRFEEAINLHQEAIASFRRSGLGTRESWNDGLDHAREHVFMNLYDLGIVFEGLNQKEVASRYFRASLYYAYENSLYQKLGMGGDRFAPRYQGLSSRVTPVDVLAIKLGVEKGAEMRVVLAGVRCANVFVPRR